MIQEENRYSQNLPAILEELIVSLNFVSTINENPQIKELALSAIQSIDPQIVDRYPEIIPLTLRTIISNNLYTNPKNDLETINRYVEIILIVLESRMKSLGKLHSELFLDDQNTPNEENIKYHLFKRPYTIVYATDKRPLPIDTNLRYVDPRRLIETLASKVPGIFDKFVENLPLFISRITPEFLKKIRDEGLDANTPYLDFQDGLQADPETKDIFLTVLHDCILESHTEGPREIINYLPSRNITVKEYFHIILSSANKDRSEFREDFISFYKSKFPGIDGPDLFSLIERDIDFLVDLNLYISTILNTFFDDILNDLFPNIISDRLSKVSLFINFLRKTWKSA